MRVVTRVGPARHLRRAGCPSTATLDMRCTPFDVCNVARNTPEQRSHLPCYERLSQPARSRNLSRRSAPARVVGSAAARIASCSRLRSTPTRCGLRRYRSPARRIVGPPVAVSGPPGRWT
jgi:hypothetical protein